MSNDAVVKSFGGVDVISLSAKLSEYERIVSLLGRKKRNSVRLVRTKRRTARQNRTRTRHIKFNRQRESLTEQFVVEPESKVEFVEQPKYNVSTTQVR